MVLGTLEKAGEYFYQFRHKLTKEVDGIDPENRDWEELTNAEKLEVIDKEILNHIREGARAMTAQKAEGAKQRTINETIIL